MLEPWAERAGGWCWSGASWPPARPSTFRRPRRGEAPPYRSRRRSRPPSPSRSPGRSVSTSSSASRTTWCRGARPGAGRTAWRDIEVAPGSRLRVAFWRDDVGIAAEGGQLRTTVRLYFTLGLAFGGVSNVIECGTPATPGVVTLPLVTTFAWHPEWRLVPTTVAGAPEVTSACPDALPGVDPRAFLTGTLAVRPSRRWRLRSTRTSRHGPTSGPRPRATGRSSPSPSPSGRRPCCG